MIKRNVPLPEVAPSNRTRSTGLTADIANLEPGESGVVSYSHSIVKATVKRIVAQLTEVGIRKTFAVWPCTSDGTALETGKEFALVACLTVAQAEKFEAERPGSTIAAR